MTPRLQQSGRFSFRWDSISDVGRVRENNEDSLIQAPEIGFLGVCDGLGGHAAGEVASAMASETIVEKLGECCSSPQDALAEGVIRANAKILDEQMANPSLRGMGTTLSALWIVPDDSGEVWVAHIGDSRIYRLRDGELAQITEDHSPVFRLHKQGVLTKDQILEHPQKNLLDKSLGIMSTLSPDIFRLDLLNGDTILICTDGLTDAMKDREIQEALVDTPLNQACRRLVDTANRKGGFDNITLVILRVESLDEANEREPAASE